MKKGLRIQAEQHVKDIRQQPDYGPIRRILFAFAASICGLLALAAFDVASNPHLVQGGKLVAFLFCVGILLPTYTLAYRAMTGRR